jgi:hypothetical protein
MERSSVLCLRTERTRRRRSPRSVRTRASPRTTVVVQTPEGRRRRRTTTTTTTKTHYCHHHRYHHHVRRRHRFQTPVEAKHHEPNLSLQVARALVSTPTRTPTPPCVPIARRARRTPVRSTPTRACRPRPTRGCASLTSTKVGQSAAVRSETVAKFTFSLGKIASLIDAHARCGSTRNPPPPDGRERCVDDVSWSRGWSRARTRRDRG